MSCVRLSDRMPAVLAGRDHWTREDEEHLAVCSDCRSEWQLLARGAVLGADLPLDGGRIGALVQQRLAAAKRESRSVRRNWLVAVTAVAAALLLIVNRPQPSPEDDTPPVATRFDVPILELDSLSVDQLQAVLETLEPLPGGGETFEQPWLHDLNEHELERVLRSLEG